MKSTFIFSILFLFLSFTASAQFKTLEIFEQWSGREGLTTQVYKSASAYDNTGALYVVGGTISTVGDYDWMIVKYSPSGNMLWQKQIDSIHQDDYLTNIVVDASCNLYVTGTMTVDTAQGWDLAVAKLDSAGNVIRLETYDHGQSFPFNRDGGVDLLVSGNYVYVTGGSDDATTGSDYITLKYSASNLNQQWVSRYNLANDMDVAGKVTLKGSKVTVTGRARQSNGKWILRSVTYDINTGAQVSVSTSSSSTTEEMDEIHAIHRDVNGNIFATGYINTLSQNKNLKVIGIDSNLVVIFSDTLNTGYNLDDMGNALVTDSAGQYLYVGGSVQTPSGRDMVLIKYNVSTGARLWVKYHNGQSNLDDAITGLAIDANDYPISTGYSFIDGNTDYHTMKWNTNGTNVLWQANYNGVANKNDFAEGISINNGDIYVIGKNGEPDGIRYKYVTVKYRERELYNIPDPDSIPTGFDCVANLGQVLYTDSTVNHKALYYESTLRTFFERNQIVHVLGSIDSSDITVDTLLRVSMVLSQDTTADLFSLNKQAHYYNFFLAHTPPGGLCRIPAFQKIYYPDVYPGIDLYTTSNYAGLVHQFVIRPGEGGKPSNIHFTYEGADTFYVNNNDQLVIETALGDIVYRLPECSQMDSSGNTVSAVAPSGFTINGNTISFTNGSYNPNLPIIIEINQGTAAILGGGDGNLNWSTYFGGLGDEYATDTKTDANGLLYIAGVTTATFTPRFNGLFMNFFGGSNDAVVSKFNSNGTRFWVTHFGGTAADISTGIGTDAGDVYVVGNTQSTNLPAGLLPPFQANKNSGLDGYIAKFRSDGQQVLWRTYYGGSGNDQFSRMEINGGNVFIVGHTESTNFPITNTSAWEQQGTSWDGTIVRLNSNGIPVWSTCFGGNIPTGAREYLHALGFDASNNLFVAGHASATDFPRPITQPAGAYVDTTVSGTNDAMYAKFDSNGNLVWSTLYGGNSQDYSHALTVTSAGDLIVVGRTYSTNLDTVPNGSAYYQSHHGNGTAFFPDGYFVKFDNALNQVWATYYGGDNVDIINDVHYYPTTGTLFATGHTSSSNFPLPAVNPPSTFDTLTRDGGSDAFIINLTGNMQPLWNTLIPGNYNDFGYLIATSPAKLYIVGRAYSDTNFPLDNGQGIPYFQGIHGNDGGSGGTGDGFISRFKIENWTPVGVEEVPVKQETLRIYPNPASNILYIYYPNDYQSLNVVNSIGQTVYTGGKSISGELQQINVTGLSAGLYFVRLTSGNKVLTGKFIVAK